MAKAFVKDGIVEFVEYRNYLEELYPSPIISYFIQIPDMLADKVCAGWKVDHHDFIEPEFLSPIPTMNTIYVPNDKEKVARHILQTEDDLSHVSKMAEKAKNTFQAAIIADIDNETEFMTENMILDNAPLLSEEWKTGVPNKKGDIVHVIMEDKIQCYKVIQDTLNADPTHTPDLVPSVFVPIDRTHEGTLDDPIPARANMEYVKGKYYMEDGKVYLMNREGMEEGESITLQYLPSQLVGQYFELVEG